MCVSYLEHTLSKKKIAYNAHTSKCVKRSEFFGAGKMDIFGRMYL